jgi:hypothetical protein
MNAVNKGGFRRYAIAALLAVGISMTIASCGGSSGGSPPQTPLIDEGPTLGITVENGSDVASAVVTAIGLSFDLGDITGDNVSAQPGDILFGAPQAKGTGILYESLLSQVQQALEDCANGGTVDISFALADPNTLSVGDRIIAVFVDCDDGLGYAISGEVDITIAEIEGDIQNEIFLLGMDLVLTNVVVSDSDGDMTAVGDFTLTLDQRDFPVLGLSMETGELEMGHADEVWTLTGCDHDMQVDIGTQPEPLTANALGRLESLLLGGNVDYETTVTVQAFGDDYPYAGEILVTGSGDSTVNIVISSEDVELRIDENGDGVVDEYVDTTWAELSGDEVPVNESTITMENAPILAREMYNAVSGFNYVTIVAGGQFTPTRAFGLLGAMDISGTFESLPIDCYTSGSANISGTKAVPTTFGSGDNIDATFDECTRDSEIVRGSMGLSISHFEEVFGEFGEWLGYAVSATVVESGLQRVFLGACHTGDGTFDTDFDYRITLPDSINVNSSASTFNVSTAELSRQLTGASVSTRITLGMSPVVVSRESSGVMTSEALIGSYGYRSVTPDESYIDEDLQTGPYAGELLVVASDNSSMRMVPVDAYNLNLDLDFDGDDVIDESIPTSYFELAYGDWFCR